MVRFRQTGITKVLSNDRTSGPFEELTILEFSQVNPTTHRPRGDKKVYRNNSVHSKRPDPESDPKLEP